MKVTCSRAVCAALLCFALPLTLFAQNFENAKDITWPTLWAVWHDLSPTDADLDALVNQQNQIRQSANAANQAELIQIAKSAFSRTLESANKSDLFRIYTNSRLSNYDDERGGAYLELFEGGRFFTINPVAIPTTSRFSPSVNQKINLYFSNEADLEFVPMDRPTWQKIARSLQTRPQVSVDMVVQPVGATQDAPSFSKESPTLYLHNHVVSLTVTTPNQRNPIVLYSNTPEPVPMANVGTLIMTGDRMSAPPISAEQVAMTWQKTVGETEPDYLLAAKVTPEYKSATEFQNPEQWLQNISGNLEKRFESFETGKPYHMNFTTRMEPYDTVSQSFKLDFTEKFFEYKSVFPYSPKPPSRRSFSLPGEENYFKTHSYRLIFNNADQLSTIEVPPSQGNGILQRAGGSRTIGMHVVFQIDSVQPLDTGVSGGADAKRIVRAKVIEVRARGKNSGLPLFQKSFEPLDRAPIALNVAPDVGLHPKDADIRGLKVGGNPDQLIADLQSMYGKAFFSKKNEQTIIYRNGQDIKGTAFVNSDYIVSSMEFNQKFDGDAVDAAADALIQKYGEPVYDSGRTKGRFDGVKRELHWTKPGVFDYKYAGVRAEIERNNTIYNGKTNMKIRITLPGNREPFKKDQTTKPKIAL